MTHHRNRPFQQRTEKGGLRVIAWETTRRCPMHCRHCRGGARDTDYAGELTTREGHRLIEALRAFGKPVLILTGGEPMARTDIYELAAHASEAGLRVAMAPCGPMLDANTARQIKEAGIQRISLSLDGAGRKTHDAFRGVEGAFDSMVSAMATARQADLSFQINTTVSQLNVDQLPAIHALACREQASALDLFFLVPTGRGRSLRHLALPADTHEQTLKWVLAKRRASPIPIRVTCAPTMARLERQDTTATTASASPPQRSSGCMAGAGFLFISHRGILQPCGFLDIPCGSLKDADFDLKSLYEASAVLQALSNRNDLEGACGDCGFRHLCGGCRARAYAATGTILAADPSCPYGAGIEEAER